MSALNPTRTYTGRYGNYMPCLTQIKVKDCFCSSQELMSNNVKLLYRPELNSVPVKKLKMRDEIHESIIE